MAMMNYPMPPAYPHTMQNYMDYSMHTPNFHNSHITHTSSVQLHHHHHQHRVHSPHFQSTHLQTPHIQYVQDDFYADDSDDESNLTSDDYEDDRMSDDDSLEREPSAVDQLLDFAEMVNTDIQKFFGKKRILDEPEMIAACNKKVQLSGRELYYADLLRVAQHGDSAEPSHEVAEPSRIIRYGDGDTNRESPSTISPKSIDGTGLGPLEELFQYAERIFLFNSPALQTFDYPTNDARPWESSAENLRATTYGGNSAVLPWRKRCLPKSFFTEPSSLLSSSSSSCQGNLDQRYNNVMSSVAVASHCAAGVAPGNHNETPDFSDLMANMEADDDHDLPRVAPVHG